MCVSWCMYVHMDASAHKKQKRVLHPLGLELKVVVNSLMWKLGTKLKTSKKNSKYYEQLSQCSIHKFQNILNIKR